MGSLPDIYISITWEILTLLIWWKYTQILSAVCSGPRGQTHKFVSLVAVTFMADQQTALLLGIRMPSILYSADFAKHRVKWKENGGRYTYRGSRLCCVRVQHPLNRRRSWVSHWRYLVPATIGCKTSFTFQMKHLITMLTSWNKLCLNQACQGCFMNNALFMNRLACAGLRWLASLRPNTL